MEESGLPCAGTCNRQTLHRREAPNHILHFLITFFTCGLWALVWIFDTNKDRPWRCTFCGTPRPQPAAPERPLATYRPVELRARTRRWLRGLALGGFTLVLVSPAIIYGISSLFDGPLIDGETSTARAFRIEWAQFTQYGTGPWTAYFVALAFSAALLFLSLVFTFSKPRREPPERSE